LKKYEYAAGIVQRNKKKEKIGKKYKKMQFKRGSLLTYTKEVNLLHHDFSYILEFEYVK